MQLLPRSRDDHRRPGLVPGSTDALGVSLGNGAIGAGLAWMPAKAGMTD